MNRGTHREKMSFVEQRWDLKNNGEKPEVPQRQALSIMDGTCSWGSFIKSVVKK